MMKFKTKTISLIYKKRVFTVSVNIRLGEKHPVVFIHGLGSTKNDFRNVFSLKELNNHTLLAFDFPGSGESGYPEESNLSIDDLVEITSIIIEGFNLMDISLVGHSMGGLTALLYAKKHPENVKNFVNIEGNIAPEDCEIFSRSTSRLSWKEFSSSDHMRNIQSEFSDLLFQGAQKFAADFIDSVIPRAFYDYCVSIVQHSDSGQLIPAFQSLDIPRLFIYGEANNHLTYFSELEEGGIKTVEIPDSHHWPHFDNPSFFYQTIVNFIT